MRHEVRDIPTAPRRVRWRPLFAHRWLLFVPGTILVLMGSLIAWLMFLQADGLMSKQPQLDAGPSSRAFGKLTKIGRPHVDWDNVLRQEVHYDFAYTYDGHSLTVSGMCRLPAGERKSGDRVEVDYLYSDPNVSCIVGGVLHHDHEWLRARFWMLAMSLPGALLLAIWLAGAFQLRQVLRHGDVSIGIVHRVRRVPFVLPEMLSVDYTFRDHHAKTRHNRHWVRAHGKLGARLLAQMAENRYEELPVLHDRALPQWNRLLLPADFWPQPPIDLAIGKSGAPS